MIKNIRSILTMNEKIIHDSRVHWIVFVRPIVYAIIGIGVGIFFHPLVGALILVMDLFAFYAAFVFYKTTHLILTEKKVLGRSGFLQLGWSQLNLGNIETAYLQEPILGRWLGYSSVIVRGTGIGNVAFPFLRDAGTFITKLEKYIDLEVHRERIINITTPSSAA